MLTQVEDQEQQIIYVSACCLYFSILAINITVANRSVEY